MKVVLHDFSGHPFQAELARTLADTGNDVEHVSSGQYVSGKGHLERQAGDSPRLTFTDLRLDLPFQKYAPLARLRFEVSYARAWIKRLKAAPPDVIVACNLPLVSMFLFARHAKRSKLPYVMWHQDIYSNGLSDELRRRLPRPIAAVGSRVFDKMEAYCARNASHVVAIGEAFKEVYPQWRVAAENVSVIPNWAPLDKVFPVERTNRHTAGFFDDTAILRLVYAGTIGRKHNPRLLVDLVRYAIDEGTSVRLAVVSEGEAADDLTAMARAESLPISVFPFQPADTLPDVLGSADVLVALLEPDATKFSVPSKVLSYMAAGRPILGLMPADNPAALDINESGGLVVDPTDLGAKAAGSWLIELASEPERVTEIGQRTRRIAEQKFDINKVTAEFNEIFVKASAARSTGRWRT